MINVEFISALATPCSWGGADLLRCAFHSHRAAKIKPPKNPIPPYEFGMEAHVTPCGSGRGRGLSSGNHTPFHRCHHIKDHMLTMDAVGGLFGVTKISLFFSFREGTVVFDVELESLAWKDIPRITNGLIRLIICSIYFTWDHNYV